jgi:tetratricopeptide (TPR) repeat protein
LKLVLLDVSHRDPQSDKSREKLGALLESVARPQKTSVPTGLAALFSCAADEESYDHADLKHGVFFHHVIEGLAGASAPDQARDVTLDLLEPYVKREVRSFVRTTHFESQVPALFGQSSRTAAITSIDEGQRAIRKAQMLVKEGESEKALAALDELVRANPKLVAARLERAAIYNELKRYDEANADAAEAVKLEPKNPDLRLTGAWYGTYAYPGDGAQPSVRFRLYFVQNGSKISLNVKEPKTFGAGNAPFLYAFGTGQYDPATRELKFTKTYDGTSGVSHSVEYTGTISEDGKKIEGNWSIGGPGGTFKAQRGAPNQDDHEDLN